MTEPREKIEKLLRLARGSSNEGEKAAALAKANLLMERYGLTAIDFIQEENTGNDNNSIIMTSFETEMFSVLKEFISEKEAHDFIKSHAFVSPDKNYQAGVLDGLREALSVIYSDSDLFSHENAADSLFETEDDLFEAGAKKSSSAKEDAFAKAKCDSLFESQDAVDSLFEDGPDISEKEMNWKKGYDEAYNGLFTFLK